MGHKATDPSPRTLPSGTAIAYPYLREESAATNDTPSEGTIGSASKTNTNPGAAGTYSVMMSANR